MVCVNDSLSRPTKKVIDVLQGSVIGPLLFIIFLNDLCVLKLHSTRLVLFVDYINMFLYGKDIYFVKGRLRPDIELINDGLQHNHVILSWGKTKANFFPIQIGIKQAHSLLSTNIYLSVDDCSVRSVPRCSCS